MLLLPNIGFDLFINCFHFHFARVSFWNSSDEAYDQSFSKRNTIPVQTERKQVDKKIQYNIC